MVPGLSAEQFGWREAKKVEGVGDLIRQIIRIHRREEKIIKIFGNTCSWILTV